LGIFFGGQKANLFWTKKNAVKKILACAAPLSRWRFRCLAGGLALWFLCGSWRGCCCGLRVALRVALRVLLRVRLRALLRVLLRVLLRMVLVLLMPMVLQPPRHPPPRRRRHRRSPTVDRSERSGADRIGSD
jgi:hypothetical protein